ncbi:MAG: restriction endonuclease subunit S [Magnetococcales bacterium]|nr:restriction endonuclease subunit S [Magnetococcales bacterium]
MIFPTAHLDQFAYLLSGGTPSKSEPSYWNGSIPWMTPKDMAEWSGTTEHMVSSLALGNGVKLAPENSCFIAVRGMSLHNEIRIVRLERSITFNQDIKSVIAKDGVDSKFLYYALSAKKMNLLESVEAAGHGTGRLPTDRLRLLGIPKVHVSTQRAIAQVLGALDDKIELNRRMNADLEAMARALFKDWFVDFGPVRAKAEGRPAYLASEIWDFFPDALDHKDKPVGWISSPLSEIAELNPRERLGKGESAPYLEMSAIPTVGCWPETPVLRSFEAGSKFQNGDTLLARITPCLENGKTAFIRCLKDGQVDWGSTEFIVIRPMMPFPEEFGYLLARNPKFLEFAIQSMTGTSGRQRVQVDSLASFEVTVPQTKLLSVFGSIIKPWFAQIMANAEESQTLSQLRDLLLPKLISGEIRVRDAEKAVEAAL